MNAEQLTFPVNESTDSDAQPLSNEWLISAAANARRDGRTTTPWLELLTANYHEHMSYSAAWTVAERKIAEAVSQSLAATEPTTS